jgi:hypothetical protein
MGVLATSAPAGAAKPPLIARGRIRCEGDLKMRSAIVAYHPLLTPRADGATTQIPVKGSLLCTGTTGSSKVHISVVRVQATFRRTWECSFDTLLSGVKQHPWTFKLKWRGVGGKVVPSTVTFTNYRGTPWLPPAPPRAYLDMPVDQGRTDVVGSYAGSTVGSLKMDFAKAGTFGWIDLRCTPFLPDRSNPLSARTVLTL